jgi:hypothetical protein
MVRQIAYEHGKGVGRMKVGFGIALISIVGFLILSSTSSPQSPQLSEEIENSLTQLALASLKVEYNILTTGYPPVEGLISRFDRSTGSHLSGEERIKSLITYRENALQKGKRYTNIDITLDSTSFEQINDRVILHAMDNIIEYFTFDTSPSPPLPNKSEGITKHDFVFSVEASSNTYTQKPYSIHIGGFQYTLIEDITEPQMLNSADDSVFCCYPEEQKYLLESPGLPLGLPDKKNLSHQSNGIQHKR